MKRRDREAFLLNFRKITKQNLSRRNKKFSVFAITHSATVFKSILLGNEESYQKPFLSFYCFFLLNLFA